MLPSTNWSRTETDRIWLGNSMKHWPSRSILSEWTLIIWTQQRWFRRVPNVKKQIHSKIRCSDVWELLCGARLTPDLSEPNKKKDIGYAFRQRYSYCVYARLTLNSKLTISSKSVDSVLVISIIPWSGQIHDMPCCVTLVDAIYSWYNCNRRAHSGAPPRQRLLKHVEGFYVKFCNLPVCTYIDSTGLLSLLSGITVWLANLTRYTCFTVHWTIKMSPDRVCYCSSWACKI